MINAMLRTDILVWLRYHAQGHERAKSRRLLLAHLCHPVIAHWPSPNDTADRALRKFKETMPEVGSCANGYLLIMTAEDRRVAESQLHGRAMAELVREKNIREKALPSGAQGELF